MKKILLVGGAGYVGSVLSQELLERGYAVKILDRLYYGDRGLKNIRDRVELVIGDMRAVKSEIFDGVNAVINVGGLSNDPQAEFNPEANYQMNTVASIRLAKLALDAGIHRYIFASTCSIYDTGIGAGAQDVVQDENSKVNPKAAYSSSKRYAEQGLLAMIEEDADFCPVILRKGTIYGFSPRMRYDLVVNSFTKDALSRGYVSLHCGGEIWRPLVDIHDVARAYIACIEAPADKVRGEIFNIVKDNFRISELALRVRESFRRNGRDFDIETDYKYRASRNYRVSGEKAARVLGFKPEVSVEDSVTNLLDQIYACGCDDFYNPRYYNILWMRMLEEAREITLHTGSLFESPPAYPPTTTSS